MSSPAATIDLASGERLRPTETPSRPHTAGFFDDPVTVWLLPDIDGGGRSAALFALYTDAYLPHGETYRTADGSGVAVWLPPGAQLHTAEQEEAFGAAVQRPRRRGRRPGLPVGRDVRRHHPTTAHYYFSSSATEPAHQGHGIGSAFLGRCWNARTGRRPAYTRRLPPGTAPCTNGTVTLPWDRSDCPRTALWSGRWARPR